MTPRKYIKFVTRDAKGNLLETPPELQKLAEMWNSQDEVSDVSEEIEVMEIDEAEDPDNPIDDDADNGPIGEDQP